MNDRRLNADEVARFQSDGYLLMPALFDAEEVALMCQALASDEGIGDRRNTMAMRDADGSFTTTVLWTDPGDDLFGAIARCERVVGGAERLLGGEVYHYHSKLTLKAPETGGTWNWHQDYGYWYFNGNLFPDMLSVFIAIDPATEANGCLQIIRGSARMGRLDHELVGGQLTAEPERVAHALERLEVVSCEMAAGDALFLHCNTLHGSSKNTSKQMPQRAALLLQRRPQRPLQGPSHAALHAVCRSCRTARSRNAAASMPEPPGASCAPRITRTNRRRSRRPTHPDGPLLPRAPKGRYSHKVLPGSWRSAYTGAATSRARGVAMPDERFAIASDHAGVGLKAVLRAALEEAGRVVIDLGPRG